MCVLLWMILYEHGYVGVRECMWIANQYACVHVCMRK
jgi:hypothetical protein